MQHTIVYSLTTGSLLLLALISITAPRKVNIKANAWLGFFLFAFGCTTLDLVLTPLHFYERYPSVQGLLEVTRLAMSPALYMSVLYFTTPDRKFLRKDYLHFLPFTLFALYILVIIAGIQNSAAFAWYFKLPEGFRKGFAFTVFASLKIQMVTYWVLSYAQLVRHQKNIRLFASTLEPIALAWLQYFLLGVVVVLFISLNELLLIIPAIVPFTHFGYLLLTFYIGYFALSQQEIYPYPQKEVIAIQEIIEEDRSVTKHERISPVELSRAKQKLLLLMENEKPYLDAELGLPQLAERLTLSTHDLSFVINEGFQENFFQFINRYRVNEAKMLLRSPKHKHLSILGIAFESGFRSKTTFNTTFKKLTGQSPSQFMEGPGEPHSSEAS